MQKNKISQKDNIHRSKFLSQISHLSSYIWRDTSSFRHAKNKRKKYKFSLLRLPIFIGIFQGIIIIPCSLINNDIPIVFASLLFLVMSICFIACGPIDTIEYVILEKIMSYFSIFISILAMLPLSLLAFSLLLMMFVLIYEQPAINNVFVTLVFLIMISTILWLIRRYLFAQFWLGSRIVDFHIFILSKNIVSIIIFIIPFFTSLLILVYKNQVNDSSANILADIVTFTGGIVLAESWVLLINNKQRQRDTIASVLSAVDNILAVLSSKEKINNSELLYQIAQMDRVLSLSIDHSLFISSYELRIILLAYFDGIIYPQCLPQEIIISPSIEHLSFMRFIRCYPIEIQIGIVYKEIAKSLRMQYRDILKQELIIVSSKSVKEKTEELVQFLYALKLYLSSLNI